MANHYKPSKKELEANAQAALDKLETMPSDLPTDTIEDEPLAVEEPDAPEIDLPADTIEDEPLAVEEPEKTIDVGRDQKAESAREARRLAETNKEYREAVEEGSKITDISQEDLRTEYPEWDEMDSVQQRLAKNDLINRKRFELIHNSASKSRQHEEWVDRVGTWVEDPKVLVANPELEGKQEEFKTFATQRERRGTDMKTLVLAFLGDRARNRISHKGQSLFPTGQGGGAVDPIKPSDGKLSVAEGRALMKKDYTKFRQMLKAGKIRNE